MLKKFLQLILQQQGTVRIVPEGSNEVVIRNGEIIDMQGKEPADAPKSPPAQKQETQETAQERPPAKEEAEKKRGRPPALERYFQTLQARSKAQLTIYGYKRNLAFWQKRKQNLLDLNVNDIEGAIVGQHPNTARRHLAALRSLAKWYLREGHPGLYNELAKLEAPRTGKRIPKHKTVEEFKIIKEQAKELTRQGDRRGIWLALMLFCGLRVSEIQTVECTDKKISVIGKGNKQRIIPAPAWLTTAIQKAPQGRGGIKQIRQLIDRELRKLGYKNLHALRHTYATMLLQHGHTLDEIQNLLGHESIATTQIYAKTQINEGVHETLEKI